MKHLLFLVFMLLSLIPRAYPQETDNFFSAYKHFLLTRKTDYLKNEKTIEKAVERLQAAVSEFEKENESYFFTSDTTYIVDFQGAETGFPSAVIWNGNNNCYYRYSNKLVKWKIQNERLDIKTDASVILNHFKKSFRNLVLKGDTAGYRLFADKYMVFDGQYVTFTKCVFSNATWTFIMSASFAVNIYDD